MARFKLGQAVVCTAHGWYAGDSNNAYGPKFNEVVTVSDYAKTPGFVHFLEYQEKHDYGHGMLTSAFDENDFEPLVSDAVLREELESVPETTFAQFVD